MHPRSPSSLSRRSFLQASALTSAALAFGVVTEPMLAYAAAPALPADHPTDTIYIDANEHPLGPCPAARDAVIAIAPRGGRYLFKSYLAFLQQYADSLGVTTDNIACYAGSTEPLNYSVRGFCSPRASYVAGDPSFEAGIFAARQVNARVVNVPLTKTYAHDVKAMLAAGPDAGLFYICTPNNPTGTLTSHSDIEYLLDNKPKPSIVLVDEAYIHFSDAPTAIDLVKAGKDVIVLRTFSKLYGMAGLRCGFAIARPDLIERLQHYGGSNPMPVTAIAAASVSLKEPTLVAERKRTNEEVRSATFDWLDRNGYSYIPSVSNCFLVNTNRPPKQVIAAMAQQNVVIGRSWPAMPSYVRITVGTSDEMLRFQEAWTKVMKG